MLELVVIVMVALAEGQESDDAAVASAVVGRVRAAADHVAERVDAEGALLDDDRAEQSGDEEGGQGGHARVGVAHEGGVAITEGGRHHEAHEGPDPLDVAVLPHDEGVGFEILDVGDGRLRLEAEEEPADMGVEEALGDIVGIFVFIHVLVVDTVVGGPIQGRILEGSGAEQEHEELHRPLGLEGNVGKQAVVAQGDAEAGRVVIEHEQGQDETPAMDLVGGVNREVVLGPEEPGDHGQRKEGRPDQEGGGHPFDAVDREVFELHRRAKITPTPH